MNVEDLKRLRRHIDLAIDLAQDGISLRPMTEQEKRAFKRKFGDADLVIAEFVIWMASAVDKPVKAPETQ